MFPSNSDSNNGGGGGGHGGGGSGDYDEDDKSNNTQAQRLGMLHETTWLTTGITKIRTNFEPKTWTGWSI
jgi:hypothetical protein